MKWKKYFQLEWNIGVHMIMYRDGEDKMGWHSDDTQGESLIISVVLESTFDINIPNHTRPVMIKNKWKDCLEKVGDEKIIRLFPCQGDAYMMDGMSHAFNY